MVEVYAAKQANDQHSIFRFRRNAPNFDKAYGFVVNNTVIISTFGSGKWGGNQNLRVAQGDEGNPDWQGGKGGLATWETELEADKTKLRLKSTKTGKYLRIWNGKVDVGGGTGEYTLFKFHKTSEQDGAFNGRLQSVKEGLFLTVGVKFKPFSNHYLFGKVNTVVLKHVGGQTLRVSPGNLENVDGGGAHGDFARWQAEPQAGGNECKFKSLKTGKYLRITNQGINAGGGGGPYTVFKVHKQGGGKVKLEAKKLGGQYPAFRDNAVKIGNGGGFTVFEIFRIN